MATKQHTSQRVQHHLDRAEHHADMADKGINAEYHKERESHHREMAEKLSKDIGPMTSGGGPLPSAL